MSVKPRKIEVFSLERVLAAAAAAICVILTAILWLQVSRQQEMWPLPALYFVEVAAASLLGLGGILRGDTLGILLAWSVVGALFGFAIMGAWSVGFFYLPVTALLGLAALWQDRQAWRRLPLHLGIALVAAVVQAALMFAVIRVVYP